MATGLFGKAGKGRIPQTRQIRRFCYANVKIGSFTIHSFFMETPAGLKLFTFRAMEWKTILGFVLALLFLFFKNYERKPRVMPPAVPVPKEKQPQPQRVPMKKPSVTSVKKAYTDKSKPNPLSHRPYSHAAKSSESVLNQAAFEPAYSSITEKGGLKANTEEIDIHDPEGDGFAERIRLQFKSAQTAREAFIYSEIFNRKI